MPSRNTLLPPCIVFEDDDLLVVNKPSGWNTHAPSPHAGEGIYEWLRHREPRWAGLAILHRLDKDTSGLIVFGKSTRANQSLTRQFTAHEVSKTYRLLTDRRPRRDRFTVVTRLVRDGDRYVAVPTGGVGDLAETRFREVGTSGVWTVLEAEPVTGRTHQIRVHAASEGVPILGDRFYGGSAFGRVCLAAVRLRFRHPGSDEPVEFEVAPDFEMPVAVARRRAILHGAEAGETDAWRELQGAADGADEGVYVDRLGQFRLVQAATAEAHRVEPPDGGGVYFKQLNRHVRLTNPAESAPRLVSGEAAPERFLIRENGVAYELSFQEGYSVGLFLDQRDNRRRWLVNHVAAGFPMFEGGSRAGREVLNTFAYTCAFSVCAALGGARATSLDLSRKYLDWGRRNFTHNGLDPAAHDFIYGDCFDWLRRLAKKGRQFDAVLLDPPTFSRSKEHGDFRADADYGKLVGAALGVLKPGGLLFASTNSARMNPEDFLGQVRSAIGGLRRRIVQEHYVPQPPDFPVAPAEPAYLKTVWMRVG